MVLASSFNAINSAISLKSVFNNCGGKCVSLTITSLADLMTIADRSIQVCKVNDDACLDPIKTKAMKSIQDFEPKVFACLTGASIVITKDNWKKVVDSFKDGITNAIKQDAADIARAASVANSQVKASMTTAVTNKNTNGHPKSGAVAPKPAILPKPQPAKTVPVPIGPQAAAIQPVSSVARPANAHG